MYDFKGNTKNLSRTYTGRMCINFTPPTRQQLEDHFKVPTPEFEWKAETWQDYLAPAIIDTGDGPFAFMASYGFVPKGHMPPGRRLTTMNARAETIGPLPTYKRAWHLSQLCLIPMQAFYEPCYETGKAVRTRIRLASGEPFAVAGMWRGWQEQDGSTSYSFTQITINADHHALMQRMHKPEDEKRSLVIIPRDQYDVWLNCKNPEQARNRLVNYQADQMDASPAPQQSRSRT
ncbi:hypothetical protein GCM10011419_28410 [Vogesella fluminis]|uniref:Abasic site processing protein n=2 Tax=Vogesella fluminis TaxID=1069161 RepID=A0ABQ3HCC0_9NEIS|nr:hypothetical protein GCM10011419_28410 [Vogesella fluminis]